MTRITAHTWARRAYERPSLRQGRASARLCPPYCSWLALIHWLELDDRGAVIAADPEGDRRRRVVDENAPDIGRARDKIFGKVAALGVEPHHAVVEHGAGPGLLILVEGDVIGIGPGR